MSTINVTNIQHSANTGDANIELFSDGSTSIKNFDVTAINGGQLAGFRNQLINGDFRIWQRGSSFSGTSAGYTADRWYSPSTSGASVSKSISREVTSLSTFSYRFYVASTDNSVVRIRQAIELDRTGKAGQYQGQWTFSFYTDDSAPTSIGISFADSRDSGNAKVWDIGEITSLGDSRYSVTATAPTPNSSNTCVLLNITPTGTTFGMTGCQFEKGSVATPYEHRPIATEFALCSRYLQQLSQGDGSYNAMHWGFRDGSRFIFNYWMQTKMRAAPSLVAVGTKGLTGLDPADLSVYNLVLKGGVDFDAGTGLWAMEKSYPQKVSWSLQGDNLNGTDGQACAIDNFVNGSEIFLDAEL